MNCRKQIPVWRSGSYFYGGDYADNTTSNLWKELEIYAAINPPGTNTPDVVYASTGTVFVAKTPELFTYDADGNMTSDGRFHYTWNGENRLVMASNDTTIVTYAYDHRGRMVTKTLCSSAPLRLIKNITYIWDDWNIIREVVREGDSVAITDYVWGLDLDGTLQGAGGVGGLLAVIRDDGVFLPTYDANGNVSEYVSTNGEIVAHYDYSPFGEPLVASGSLAATFTHQFSTKPYCSVTGFSEYQMRKYMPEIGRWMSRDPIGERWDAKIYCAVGNDIANNIDVLGLDNYYSLVGKPCPYAGDRKQSLIKLKSKECWRNLKYTPYKAIYTNPSWREDILNALMPGFGLIGWSPFFLEETVETSDLVGTLVLYYKKTYEQLECRCKGNDRLQWVRAGDNIVRNEKQFEFRDATLKKDAIKNIYYNLFVDLTGSIFDIDRLFIGRFGNRMEGLVPSPPLINIHQCPIFENEFSN